MHYCCRHRFLILKEKMLRSLIILLCFAPFIMSAQAPAVYKEMNQEIPADESKEFQFLAFFYNHVQRNNYYPTNDFLRGQVVGRLFGPNTSGTSDEKRAVFFEQRILPFFIYQPKLFNGRAILRASFEIDFTWGDGAYGTGGNSGSAPSSDQVNIQTQNIEIEYIPAHKWAINLGLQRMYDTPFNPYRTFAGRMFNTGLRLNNWGTDGIGITVRRDGDFNSWKAGFFQLYENEIQSDDDVYLWEFQYRHTITQKWNAGASLFYVRDRANGQGGPSILGQGLNSTLVAYNGGFRFPFGSDPYRADIGWIGAHFGYNDAYMLDNLFATGYVNYNLGRTSVFDNESDDRPPGWYDGPTIGGLAANLRAGYRHGQSENDLIWIDAMYTTGDQSGIKDDHYSGVISGNSWATPGALHVEHGGYILFPHANVVNRYIGAATDISNIGYGISAIHVNAAKDIIPYKFNAKIGLASAISNATPVQGGTYMGTEANFKLSYNLGTYMSIELHAAKMWLGDFYDSPLTNGDLDTRPVDPFTTFISYKWLMF